MDSGSIANYKLISYMMEIQAAKRLRINILSPV